MAKTQEELIRLKNEYKSLNNRLKELTDDELKKVAGGSGPAPNPSPVPSQDEPSANGQAIVDRAESCIGKPYAWGTVGPEAYDDSGLVSYCVSGVHTRIGTCSTFMNWPRASSPSLGDVCVSAVHCGIYIGNGEMIHAPTYGQTVCIGPVQPDMIFVKP